MLKGLPTSAQRNGRLLSQVDIMQLHAPSASRGSRKSEGEISAFHCVEGGKAVGASDCVSVTASVGVLDSTCLVMLASPYVSKYAHIHVCVYIYTRVKCM